MIEVRNRENVSPEARSLSPFVGRISDFEDELYELDRRRYEAHTAGRPLGPNLSSFPTLQSELGGALYPGLHILHGQPGCGKTALALQIAATCQCPALYVTAEMSKRELIVRLMAQVNDIYLGRFRTGEYDPDQLRKFRQNVSSTSPDLFIADATCRDFAAEATWIRNMIPVVRGENEHVLLVIDSVHDWARRIDENTLSEYECLNLSLDALVELGEQLNLPIIGIAQRNRAAMASGGLSAARGTSGFEYKAWSIWDLASDDDSSDPTSRTITLTLSKNRYGSPNRQIPLGFNGPLMTFWEL